MQPSRNFARLRGDLERLFKTLSRLDFSVLD
jgi:hypothetical protein